MTTLTATNAATLQTALAIAFGGDLIELAPGEYGELVIDGQNYTSDVTLRAVPALQAIFRTVNMSSSSHIVLDGLAVHYVPATSDANFIKPVHVDRCEFLTFLGCSFKGPIDSSGFGGKKGLFIENSDDITVEQCEMWSWSIAFSMMRGNRGVVRGNNIHLNSTDCMRLHGWTDMLIERNWFHSAFREPGSAHNDFFQAWTADGEVPNTNLVFQDNFLDAELGDISQALFANNVTGDNDPVPGKLYRNWLVQRNVIYNGHKHGIYLIAHDGVTVRENWLLHNTEATGQDSPGAGKPQIRFSAVSLNVICENNVSHEIGVRDPPDDASGILPNILQQQTDPLALGYWGGTWLADRRQEFAAQTGPEGVATPVEPPVEPPADDPVSDPETDPTDPIPVLDVQPALDALQAQIDMNLGRLVTLEDAHDALVADVDARFSAMQTLSDARQASNEAAATALKVRVTNLEAKLSVPVTVWRA